MSLHPKRVAPNAILCAVTTAVLIAPVPLNAQTVSIDFSKWSGPPLVKTKVAVYQTPFLGKTGVPALTDMATLLDEAGVQDLRYEMGWGKPDTFAFDQITGDAANPTVDFTRLDPFVSLLAAKQITPLFAMTYNPLPLKSGDGWQRWKDAPKVLSGWEIINRKYARHYRTIPGLPSPFYEIWNEPDLPGDGGKVFFNGKPEEYAGVYKSGAKGIHAGAEDARAGGPGIAYDIDYARAIVSAPVDFMSIHAYNNYAQQINSMRAIMASRPDVPILVTEYASYDTFGLNAPVSRHQGAARFFRDVNGLLQFQDVPKVYWAQWIDDDLGMVTHGLRRKAIFNAYRIYQTMMPVDRNVVKVENAGGVHAMASSDSYTGGVVLWNESASPHTVTVDMAGLPFHSGALHVYRIDAAHASVIDSPTDEALTVVEDTKIDSHAVTWTGEIPAESVVYLHAHDLSSRSLLQPASIGKFDRSLYWYPNRSGGAYADYDPRTSIIRLGAGTDVEQPTQIGNVIDQPVKRVVATVTRSGPLTPASPESLFGLRIDYGSVDGGFTRSVLWHSGSYAKKRTTELPWGKGGASVDNAYNEPKLLSGRPFVIDIARNAPKQWNHRILLTPILQNMGAGTQVRIVLTPEAKK